MAKTKEKKSTERHSCCGRVYDSRSVFASRCRVNAKYFEDGKWWCHNHAPSKVKEREEAKSNRWENESKLDDARRNSQNNVYAAEDGVIAAARELCKLNGDVTKGDRAKLEKALKTLDERIKRRDEIYEEWRRMRDKKLPKRYRQYE